MKISLSDLMPFKEICRRICLNIPPHYQWQWDARRTMAAVVLDGEDSDLVFFPLFKEFRQHWNFTSINDAAPAVNDYIHSQYGLMPGQILFTSQVVCSLVLGVAWWPWGDSQRVSMRVGLIPLNSKPSQVFAYQCLSRWLNIDTPADLPKAVKPTRR
jgi:hypothetical protein